MRRLRYIKKIFYLPRTKRKKCFQHRKPGFSFQKSRRKDIPDRKQVRREQTRTVYSQKAKKEGKRLPIPVTPETLQKKVTPENVNDSEAFKELAATGNPDVDKDREPFGQAMEENRKGRRLNGEREAGLKREEKVPEQLAV